MQNPSTFRRGKSRFLLALGLLLPLAASLTGVRAATSVAASSSTATPQENASAQPPPAAKKGAKASPASATKAAPTTGDSSTPAQAITLPTVVVTAATRTPQAPDTTATSTTIITRKEFAERQYTSVVDALSKVAGLAVVQSGVPGQVTSVFIRGGDSNQTLLTIDGRRQPVGLSGATDFTNLTLDNIERIEVVRTPASALQGGNAAGGVINIVTLNGRGLEHPESSVTFEGGSYDTFRGNVQSRGAYKGFDYAVSASDETSNMNRVNENYRNTVYRGNFGYEITPDVYVDVHSGYSLANAGSPNTIYTPDPVGRIETEDWFISPEVTAKVTDFFTTKFYYNHDQQRQNFHDPYTNFTTFQFPASARVQIDTDAIDWQNNLDLARNWQVTAGIQGDDSSVWQFDDLVGMRTLQNSLTNIAGYVESQWQPVEGLNVLTSLREDQYSDFDGAFSWRQGIAYRTPCTQTLIHGSAASSYTPPSLQQLYFPGFSNPLLKPETSLGWEIGVEQPLAGGRVTPGITYFHNDITNYIQYDAFGIPHNVGQATTDGVEIEVKSKPIDELTLDLNYTYLNAENNSTGVRLVRRPRNSLNFTAAWNPIKPLTLSAGGSWIMSRQDFDAVTFAQVTGPDYFVLRASASYEITKNVSIWVRGENLGDAHYQPVLGYPALGAAGYGGVKVSF